METLEQRFTKFRTVRQPPVCLQIALEDYFREETPEACRQAYGEYLRKRIRSAVEQLIDREDVDKLEILEQQGMLPPALLEEFLQLAIRKEKTASMVWLLQRKQALCGFPDPDFSL